MHWLTWVLRLIIPFFVLYAIGYLVPGFSALTIMWLILLTLLIRIGDWLAGWAVGDSVGRVGRGIITFLVATVVIFTATLAIEGGHVPFGGSLLAALIIALLETWLLPQPGKKIVTDGPRND